MTAVRLDIDGARHAAAALPEIVDADLRRRFRQLPVLLRRTGLAATLATLLARAARPGTGAAYQEAARHLAQVIAPTIGKPADTPAQDILTALGGLDPARYAIATRRADHMLTWLKRLADARYLATPPPVEAPEPEDEP